MSDFENRNDERRNWRDDWREERRKRREEWRARFRGQRHDMTAGVHMRSSGIWTGVFILLIGVAALIKATVTDLPNWVFSWQTFLIALGFFIGIKHGFRGASWFILMLIGGAFLIPEINPDISIRRYIWPGVLIVVGALLIIRPRRHHHWQWDESQKKTSGSSGIEDAKVTDQTYESKEDYVDSTSILGGSKKTVISKNFKGGDLVSIFGGTELDLSRADFTGTATLELTTIFGGTKLIIPSNWTVKSDAAVIFGGIEDKRTVTPTADGAEKILILKGTVMFGGVDIRSY
ncbi:MAG TPA: LiaF domain-containing protein [Chitinophagaceae bacterium]